MADIAFKLGGANQTGVPQITDNKSGSAITATFSALAVGSVSDATLATFAVDPANPNQIIGTPLASGTGTVVITAHADYTDPGDGSAQSVDLSVAKNFSVSAAPDGVTFDVVFS